MRKGVLILLTTLALGALLSVPPSAQAITILYEAIDLADITLGEDLWRYTYTSNSR